MHTWNPVDAIVLAGGINRIPLYQDYQPGYKALLPLAGKPSIQYSLEALQALPQVRSIRIVGDRKQLEPLLARIPSLGSVEILPSGESLVDSVRSGLYASYDLDGVLVATADQPLITSSAVADFLQACEPVESDWDHNLFLSVIPEKCYTGEYRRFTKPFNHFRDVSICHGNLGLVDPKIIDNQGAMECIGELYRNRKNPLTSALSVGAAVGIAYLLGVHALHALTLAQFAEMASRRLGIGVLPVFLEHPEVSLDMDDADDYRFIATHFVRLAQAGAAA